MPGFAGGAGLGGTALGTSRSGPPSAAGSAGRPEPTVTDRPLFAAPAAPFRFFVRSVTASTFATMTTTCLTDGPFRERAYLVSRPAGGGGLFGLADFVVRRPTGGGAPGDGGCGGEFTPATIGLCGQIDPDATEWLTGGFELPPEFIGGRFASVGGGPTENGGGSPLESFGPGWGPPQTATFGAGHPRYEPSPFVPL